MIRESLADAFAPLSTAALCDAAMRCDVPVRIAPPGLRSIPPGARITGRVLPARHAGSVDVFLEALEDSRPGDVLVIDDGGRTEAACIGDLVALECRAAGLAGILVWGAHRDTWDLREIGLPVFSYGAVPAGPAALEERHPMALASARVGTALVARGELVFADEDGALFLGTEAAEAVLPAARRIRETERRQAEAQRAGTSLRAQLGLRDFLRRRAADPALTFRVHLRERGGEIEFQMNPMRERFGIPERVHYLNHAYMSPLSRAVATAGEAAMDRMTRPWEIGPPEFFESVSRIRERFARLIGASDPERVAVIPATSYGLSQVARNTTLTQEANVVMVQEEFPSNRYVWGRRCREAGAELRVVAGPEIAPTRGEAWSARVMEAIDDHTAVVTLSSVHWCDGTRLDLEAIGARARNVGAALVIDGTQSIGAIPFRLDRLQPDAVICAGYKWLTGPYSFGAAWMGDRYDHGVPIEEAWMARERSDDFAGLVRDAERYRPGAARYDVGETANFLLAPMLAAALDQVLEWGPARVESHAQRLTRPLLEELAERGFAIGSREGGHLIGIRLPAESDLETVRRGLRERRVHVSFRGDAIRISCHLYNDDEDVQALRDALLS